MNKISDVESYINQFDSNVTDRLQSLRAIIANEVPEATESCSYGLIGYKYMQKPLVYIGGFRHHVGFYATPNGHKAFEKEFSKYKQGKGSVQFPNNQPLPLALVTKVVRYRQGVIANEFNDNR